MASACYNVWVVYQNSKGLKKWVNEGPAPDGACPSCPQMNHPAAGTWNGYSAACTSGAIIKMLNDGNGNLAIGPVIVPAGTPRAIAACTQTGGDYFIGEGSLSNYF